MSTLDVMERLRTRRESYHLEIRRSLNEARFRQNRIRNRQLLHFQKLPSQTRFTQYQVDQYLHLIENVLLLNCHLDDHSLQAIHSMLHDLRLKISHDHSHAHLYVQKLISIKNFIESFDFSQAAAEFSQLTNLKLYTPDPKAENEKVATPYHKMITHLYDNDLQVLTLIKNASNQILSSSQKQQIQGLNVILKVSHNPNYHTFVYNMKAFSKLIDNLLDSPVKYLCREIIYKLSESDDEIEKLCDQRVLQFIQEAFRQSANIPQKLKAASLLKNLTKSEYGMDLIIENEQLLYLIKSMINNDAFQIRQVLYSILAIILEQSNNDKLYSIVDSTGFIDLVLAGLSDVCQDIVIHSLLSKLGVFFMWLVLKSIFHLTRNLNQSNFVQYLESRMIPQQLEHLTNSKNQTISELASEFLTPHPQSACF